MLAALIAACAPPDPAAAYEQALDPTTPVEDALDLCADAGDDADACLVAVARRAPDAAEEACARIVSPKWAGECAFGLAERRAKAGDRWGALAACGQAGDYYNECLYHAWTFELQGIVDELGHASAGIDRAREVVAFWSGLETIGPDAADQIWRDWWYFAHARNKPASLAWCAELPEADRARCEDGTRTFVRRTVVETLIRASTPPEQKDRLCRGSPEDAKAVLGDLYVPDPALDAEVAAGLAMGCGPGPVDRPWNPVFRQRRGEGALVPPPGGAPPALPPPPGAPEPPP